MSTVRPYQHRRRYAGLAVAAAYAVVAARTPPLTDAAAVAVGLPSAVLLGLAARRPPARRAVEAPPPARRTALGWGAVVLLVAGWDLAAWLQQPAYDVATHAHPTVSLLLDPVTEPWPWRLAAWCCWLYVGYRLVRR